MRILAALSMILCFLSILIAIWWPGMVLRGGISSTIFLVLSALLYGISDPELRNPK